MPTLAAPTALKATAVSPTQIDLSWKDKSTGETGVTVYRKAAGDANWTWIADLPPNSTTYSDKGVTASSTYSYRVEAFQAMPSTSVDAATPSDGGGGGGNGGSTLNSIKEINDDMTLPHEAKPNGVPADWDWAEQGRVNMGNNPGQWTAANSWGQFYHEANASDTTTNTRVQVRNIHLYVLSRASQQWQHMQGPEIPIDGAGFKEDFSDNPNSVPLDIRQEPEGGVSAKMIVDFNFHFWPRTRATIDPNDIAGMFGTFQARLVEGDPNQPNDFAAAHVVVDAGGDYYADLNAQWPNNGDWAIARFKKVGAEWRPINVTTLSLEQLQQNPPPLE
jgi:hypothetical protein